MCFNKFRKNGQQDNEMIKVMDYPDSLWIVRTVFSPSEQFPCQPDSFEPFAKTFRIFAKTFRIAILPHYHGCSDTARLTRRQDDKMTRIAKTFHD